MGYMRHHAIVVTGFNEKLEQARHKAIDLGCEVSELVESNANGYRSFLVASDGSKEGWQESEDGDRRRDKFVAWMELQRYEDQSSPLAWVEVLYGDDELDASIVRDSDSV